MKKTLSLILALLMTASCASAIFADDTAIADEAADVEATAAIDEEAPVEEATEEATPYDGCYPFPQYLWYYEGYGRRTSPR